MRVILERVSLCGSDHLQGALCEALAFDFLTVALQGGLTMLSLIFMWTLFLPAFCTSWTLSPPGRMFLCNCFLDFLILFFEIRSLIASLPSISEV